MLVCVEASSGMDYGTTQTALLRGKGDYFEEKLMMEDEGRSQSILLTTVGV